VGTPARHVYELRVVDPTTGEQLWHSLTNLLEDLILGALGDGGGSIFAEKVELRIVERENGHVVASMHASNDAQSLARLIADDLDRLDADQFATEWGIHKDEAPSTS
jgi:hypothetical protein